MTAILVIYTPTNETRYYTTRVWQMAEKEKDHLNWLIDNNAPKDMIETSQRYLSHFRQRHKEYIEYADGL